MFKIAGIIICCLIIVDKGFSQVITSKHVYLQYTVPDSFFLQLQARFDTTVAVGYENLGWGVAGYEMISVKDGVWRGFRYKLDAGSPSILLGLPDYNIDSFIVDQHLCRKALLALFNQPVLKENKTDTITCVVKEKQGYLYPEINDASSLCVYLITAPAVIKKKYYAPRFYEGYCPNKVRKMLMQYVDKVKVITGNRVPWY